ncbi:uncharacterized protein RHO25_012381 [Cercospora beticola]|uniref:Uncharacterized protein n=1 Tax=Cercospora beticola TaxID=122368 RepID=A0ABZ0P734_CERBT|nr:hypothetical protein RHO25_012381 [Cercospora beticola]
MMGPSTSLSWRSVKSLASERSSQPPLQHQLAPSHEPCKRSALICQYKSRFNHPWASSTTDLQYRFELTRAAGAREILKKVNGMNPRDWSLDSSVAAATTADRPMSARSRPLLVGRPPWSDHREVQVLSRSKDFRKDTAGVEKSPKRGGCRDYEPPFKYLPVRKRSVLPKRFGDEKLARQSEEDVATNAVESSAVVGDPASEPAADADEPETWNLVSTSLVTDTDTSSWKNIVPISAATSVEDEQYSPPKYSISDPSDTGEIEEEEYDE